MLLYVIYLNGAIELLIAANVIFSISMFYRFIKSHLNVPFDFKRHLQVLKFSFKHRATFAAKGSKAKTKMLS